MINLCTCSECAAPATNARRFSALRADPSRTAGLRLRFMSALRVRFDVLMRDLQRWLVKEDALSLNAYQFSTDSERLKEFNRWLDAQIEQKLLTKTPAGNPWTKAYIAPAFQQGAKRAMDQVSVRATVQSELLRRSFMQPETLDKIELLATRSFEYMKGMTQDMKAQLNRILSDGMMRSETPSRIAARIRDQLDISQARAERIARTEIVHAQAEGQLNSFKALAVPGVGVEAEFVTMEDDKVCPQCEKAARAGPYTLDEAHGLIPVHPNCRCSFLPIISEQTMNLLHNTENVLAVKNDLREFWDGIVNSYGHYDPTQPRDRSGRWTDGDGIVDGRPRLRTISDVMRVERGAGGGASTSIKSTRAKLNFKKADKWKQVVANKWQTKMARVVGGKLGGVNGSGRDENGYHLALDVYGAKGAYKGLECKARIDPTSQPRVDMRPDCRAKKESECRALGWKGAVINVDLRHGADLKNERIRPGTKPIFYFKPGFGAFSYGTMMRTTSLKKLRLMVQGKIPFVPSTTV